MRRKPDKNRLCGAQSGADIWLCAKNRHICSENNFKRTMNEQNWAEAPLYPVGLQDFEKIRRNNYLYVDKTELVYKNVYLQRNNNERDEYETMLPRRATELCRNSGEEGGLCGQDGVGLPVDT
jgi:hypothetical protein